jgi:hypothetical protein
MVREFWNALTVEHGTESTHKHSNILKIKNSYVKKCESSRCILATIVSIVTCTVVLMRHITS